MKAVVAENAGTGDGELVVVDRPVPRPQPGEVLVKVAAAGVNRPDILQRRGLYPPPPGAPDILGLEMAGEIVAAGKGAEEVMGQRVCALVALGRQDLDPLSIEELVERIEALKAEIARVEQHMQRAEVHRSAAEELFKKS